MEFIRFYIIKMSDSDKIKAHLIESATSLNFTGLLDLIEKLAVSLARSKRLI